MKAKSKLACACLFGFLSAVMTIIGARIAIKSVARGRLYSDVATIPYRRVGLVLGCARKVSDGRTNLFYAHRIRAAAELFHHRKVDYLIVSGDNHVRGYDEASDMKQSLMDAGVPVDRIYCDHAGFRTLDSMVRAKKVFGQSEITVVSQRFHNERAIYIATYNGLDAIGFNATDVNTYSAMRTRIREALARVKTIFDVHLLGTQPKFLGSKISI